MAFILNLYRDAQCKTPALSPVIGVAGITGYYADQTHWASQTLWGYTFYRVQLTNSAGRDGVILSGASPIFDFQRIADREIFTVPETNAITTDTERHSSTTKIYNVFFAGINTQSGNRLTSNTIQFTGSQSPNWFNTAIRLQQYNQEPLDATGADRTSWTYNVSSQYFTQSAQLTGALQQCVCVYKFPMWGAEFYLFALGVSSSGEPNSDTRILAVPGDFFKDKEVKPYVGPVSKDSAAEFTPTTPKRDSIASRDLTGKKNPYGFNTGNGLKLLLLSAQEQADIVKRLYTGRSGDDLNAIGQTLSGVIGGNTHRPADELKTMIDAVLCCHIVPVISSGYAGGTNALYTIAGYQLYNPAKAVTQVSDQIITVTTLRTYIAPIVNNFLTYAPYCSVSLSVPFVGDIPLDTSALFASSIYFVFYLDLYTGTLSVDVHLVDDDGRDYIYTTRQTNCAVDIPIMGTGATGNPLQKIASAAGNVASAGVLGAPTAVYNVATATVDAQHATAIGRGASSNIAPYFSQRHCYLVVEYAESANAESFFDLNGGALEKSGTVGEFRGYTEFTAVDVSGIAGATDAEKRQIEQILKGGVYL